MLSTADRALEATMRAKGLHHVADYIPKEELDKFLKKGKTVQSCGPVFEWLRTERGIDGPLSIHPPARSHPPCTYHPYPFTQRTL